MKLRWPHGLAAVALLLGAVAVVVFCIFQFGIAQRWARNALLHQLEASTGARVELGGFHLHALRMRAELDNLTMHGYFMRTACRWASLCFRFCIGNSRSTNCCWMARN